MRPRRGVAQPGRCERRDGAAPGTSRRPGRGTLTTALFFGTFYGLARFSALRTSTTAAVRYRQRIVRTGDTFSSGRSMNPCPCAPHNDSTCPSTGSGAAGERSPQFSCAPGSMRSAGDQDEVPARAPHPAPPSLLLLLPGHCWHTRASC